jgi:mono/diheme cytochrome c family protein
MKKAAFVAALLFPALAATAEQPRNLTQGSSGAGVRGKYIVEQVAMCVECHTPRDENGRLMRTRYLEGAPVPVKAPPFARISWALRAPAIAGLPGYTVEQGIRLLTDGVTADGRHPSAPMPSFRLTRADAEAVVAYLKSLQ